jgi:hypothetical protein
VVQIESLRDERTDALPDDALRAIQRRLNASGYHALRQIEFEYCNRVVVLRGRVTTYYAKQLAQSLLLADPAIERVENLIEVINSRPGHQARSP